jgi:hypothetical protein
MEQAIQQLAQQVNDLQLQMQAAQQQPALPIQQIMQQMNQLQAQVQAVQQPAAPHPHALKPVRPDIFDGSSTLSVETWIFQLQQYFDLVGVVNQEQRALFASSLLRGHASVWWRLQVTSATPITTWDAFQAGIIAQFRRIDPQRQARQSLSKLKQASTVEDYTIKFRQLMLDIGNTMSDLDKIQHYKQGLKLTIRRELEIRNPETLADCIMMAERIDAIDSSYLSPASASQPATRVPDPMDIDVLDSSKPRFRSQERNTNGGGQIKQRFQRQWTTQASQNTRRGGSEIRCFECNGQGHLGRECPTRAKRLKNKQPLQGQGRFNAMEEEPQDDSEEAEDQQDFQQRP